MHRAFGCKSSRSQEGGVGDCRPAVVLKATGVDEFTKGDYVGAKRRGSGVEPCLHNLKNH